MKKKNFLTLIATLTLISTTSLLAMEDDKSKPTRIWAKPTFRKKTKQPPVTKVEREDRLIAAQNAQIQLPPLLAMKDDATRRAANLRRMNARPPVVKKVCVAKPKPVVAKRLMRLVTKPSSSAMFEAQIRLAFDQIHTVTNMHFGLAYLKGKGVKKNPTKGFQYIKKTADRGYAPAQDLVGLMYFEGKNVEKDIQKTCEYLKKSADAGYAPAQKAVFRMYLKRENVERDIEKAREYLIKAHKTGDRSVENDIRSLYFQNHASKSTHATTMK